MLHKFPRLLPGAVLVIAIGVWPLLTRAASPSNNNQAAQQFQQLQRQIQQQQQQMMRLIQQAQQQGQRQARTQQRAMARNAKSAPRPVLKNVIAEYEFVLADDALARSISLTTTEMDEKGRPRKLDAEEKKKLKGDTPEERKLVGYKAAVEDLQVGDEVIVTLSQHRPKKKTASPGAESEKSKGKDKDKDADAKEKDADKKEAEKPKEKDADKDADTKKEGKKEKDTKEGEKESDDNDDAHKLGRLKDWKPYTRMAGTIVEADMSGSRRVTIAIQGQQVVMQQPNRNGNRNNAQNNNNNNNKNNNNNQNPKPTHTSIDPSTLQGTFVIVTKHTDKIGGFTGTAAKK